MTASSSNADGEDEIGAGNGDDNDVNDDDNDVNGNGTDKSLNHYVSWKEIIHSNFYVRYMKRRLTLVGQLRRCSLAGEKE